MADGVVETQRPVEDAASDLATLGHSGQPSACASSMALATISTLSSSVGRMFTAASVTARSAAWLRGKGAAYGGGARSAAAIGSASAAARQSNSARAT